MDVKKNATIFLVMEYDSDGYDDYGSTVTAAFTERAFAEEYKKTADDCEILEIELDEFASKAVHVWKMRVYLLSGASKAMKDKWVLEKFLADGNGGVDIKDSRISEKHYRVDASSAVSYEDALSRANEARRVWLAARD
jgi:hypothetical protein